MDVSRIGIGLPIVGRYAGPEAIAAVAGAADELGFGAVSVFERLLLPASPGWRNSFGLPESPVYDALETLTWVAARTERVRLVTGVLVALFQPPVVLARRLATVDHLSGGRLEVGLAQGWLPEEFAATGAPAHGRGAAFEEHLTVMRACWGPDPVRHAGPNYPVPRSRIGPKPINGTIPVLVGGVTPAALRRAARIGDGVILGFRDWDSTLAQIDEYRDAGGIGRIVLRAGPMRADDRHPQPPAHWTERSILDDLARAEAAGVDEVIWDLALLDPHPDQIVSAMRTL